MPKNKLGSRLNKSDWVLSAVGQKCEEMPAVGYPIGTFPRGRVLTLPPLKPAQSLSSLTSVESSDTSEGRSVASLIKPLDTRDFVEDLWQANPYFDQFQTFGMTEVDLNEYLLCLERAFHKEYWGDSELMNLKLWGVSDVSDSFDCSAVVPKMKSDSWGCRIKGGCSSSSSTDRSSVRQLPSKMMCGGMGHNYCTSVVDGSGCRTGEGGNSSNSCRSSVRHLPSRVMCGSVGQNDCNELVLSEEQGNVIRKSPYHLAYILEMFYTMYTMG